MLTPSPWFSPRPPTVGFVCPVAAPGGASGSCPGGRTCRNGSLQPTREAGCSLGTFPAIGERPVSGSVRAPAPPLTKNNCYPQEIEGVTSSARAARLCYALATAPLSHRLHFGGECGQSRRKAAPASSVRGRQLGALFVQAEVLLQQVLQHRLLLLACGLFPQPHLLLVSRP